MRRAVDRELVVGQPLVRCDEKMEEVAAKQTIEMLQNGKRVAVVTDAGTPGISDPGGRLVARVRMFAPEVTIEAIPGASALTAALSIAGLNSSEFVFMGFLRLVAALGVRLQIHDPV